MLIDIWNVAAIVTWKDPKFSVLESLVRSYILPLSLQTSLHTRPKRKSTQGCLYPQRAAGGQAEYRLEEVTEEQWVACERLEGSLGGPGSTTIGCFVAS